MVDGNTKNVLNIHNIPYGSSIFIKKGAKIKKGDVICQWDPFNGVIVSEFSGKISYENIEQGVTYQVEIDEQTGFQEKVISESRNKLIPTLHIKDVKGNILRSYNLPVGAHLIVNDGDSIKEGKNLGQNPKKISKVRRYYWWLA